MWCLETGIAVTGQKVTVLLDTYFLDPTGSLTLTLSNELCQMSQLVLAKERSGEGTGTVEVASCSCAAGYIGRIPHCILARDCDKDRECQRSRECWKCFK